MSEVSTAPLSRTTSQPSIMNSEMSSTSRGIQYNENDTGPNDFQNDYTNL